MDVMIDIETWGTEPSAAIRAIGLVAFDPAGTENLEVTLLDARSSIDDQIEHGRTLTEQTMEWWRTQNALSEALIAAADDHGPDVIFANTQFVILNVVQNFVIRARSQSPDDKITIWSRGHFDIQILEHLFRANRMPPPWKFYEIADVRTLDKFCTKPKSTTPHEPLADCFAQVEHVRETVRKLGLAA